MLPQSLLKNDIDVGRTSCIDTESLDEGDNINDYFNNDIILEGEEEYDVLNDETFGGGETDIANEESNDLESVPTWEEYDLHNNETFGAEDLNYDWEAEHEKMVNNLEKKIENKDEYLLTTESPNKKLDLFLEPEVQKQNGYHNVHDIMNNSYYIPKDSDYEESNFQNNRTVNFQTLERKSSSQNYQKSFDTDRENFENIETLTNDNCHRILKHDKWYNNFENTSNKENFENAGAYSQGYSLFSSGANLLQNAGIHIPSGTDGVVTSAMNSDENTQKNCNADKLLSSECVIPNVADLEKRWINDAASKTVITADCFRAYNSAFFVNNSSSTIDNGYASLNSNFVPPAKRSIDPFGTKETFRDTDANNILVMQLQKKMHTTSVPQSTSYRANGENDLQSMFYSKLNLTNRPSLFDQNLYPVPVITDTGILLCDNTVFKNSAGFAEMNARTGNAYMNGQSLKLNQVGQSAITLMSDVPTHMVENSLLMENSISNSHFPRLNMNIFPPPGLTIDPSKLCQFQNTTTLQSQQRPASYITLPPPQVVNGIVTVERQKQMNKMQKECNLSQVDEYAGLMTEREKYWLAGVQLLQINSMDPHKDDYYFTNYQARRKGNNRNKNQNINNANWKNQQNKDYSPLQFENSLGRVQIGSVVAPRKVIDTYLIEGSPKHSRLGDFFIEDPIANTSNRKRKAIMLHIENMYGKIIALENLQFNSGKSKNDPETIKAEFENIVKGLREEILNLKDDFKIIMSIKKGKRLILRFLCFCDNPDEVWYLIFEILDRIIRSDREHGVLLSYLPYFRTWLSSADMNTLIHITHYFQRNLKFFLQDKFSVSVIANMIEHAEVIYFYSGLEEQTLWMEFIISLAESAHCLFDSVQKPVVSVKPQILRSHLLKCKKLENGYMSYLLKIFSNNPRK